MELKYPLNNAVGLVLLATVIIMEFHISFQQHFCPDDYYPKENAEGLALTNSVYNSFSSASFAACLMACEADMSCMSLNYLMTTSTCDLNTQTKESTPGYFIKRHNSIYSINPSGRTKSKIGKGNNPAKSCLEILKSGASTGSGEYRLDPTNTGTPIQAFCDMTTDGGGWTIVTKLVQPSNTQLPYLKPATYEIIKEYSRTDVYVLPMAAAMLDIKNKMGFHQIHFYCHKVSVGRVVSIMTRNDTAGQAVVDFFTDTGAVPVALHPAACDSFDRLPEDTSFLSRNCSIWGGHEGDTPPVPTQTWGAPCCGGPMRLPGRPFQIAKPPSRGFEFVGFFLCDNEIPLNTGSAVPPRVNDTWQISVR